MPHTLPDPPEHARLLVADIGGTHARFAWASTQGQIASQTSSRTALHTSLAAALEACVPQLHDAQALCIGIAGQVDSHGTGLSANLPWKISASDLQQRYQRPTRVINDFQALALGCSTLPPDAGQLIHGPQHSGAPRRSLVIGPGTGLGSALLLHGQPPNIIPSEAGQIALAASTTRQAALIALFRQQHEQAHISVEHAVSGPGLVNIYQAICALDGQPSPLQQPEAISHAALAGNNPQAAEALQLFFHWLGGFAADLAMAMAADCIWLAGGIVPKMAAQAGCGGFNAAFDRRGVLSPWLKQRPVRVIEHAALGLIGAALSAPSHPLQHGAINDAQETSAAIDHLPG